MGMDMSRPVLGPQPWPEVNECYGHKNPWEACAQCNGDHDHVWRRGLARWSRSIPVRCRLCGARKCDMPACTERRHHRGPHLLLTGEVVRVGA